MAHPRDARNLRDGQPSEEVAFGAGAPPLHSELGGDEIYPREPATPTLGGDEIYPREPATPTLGGDEIYPREPAAPTLGGDEIYLHDPAVPTLGGDEAFPGDPRANSLEERPHLSPGGDTSGDDPSTGLLDTFESLDDV